MRKSEYQVCDIYRVFKAVQAEDLFESWERQFLLDRCRAKCRNDTVSEEMEYHVSRLMSDVERLGIASPSILEKSLPVSCLAAPIIKGDQRRLVLAFHDQYTVGDMLDFVRRKTRVGELAAVVKTEMYRERIIETIQRFENCVSAWELGVRKDDRVNWIIPPDMELNNDTIYSAFSKCGVGSAQIAALHCVAWWLPWVSLEIIYFMKRIRNYDRVLIAKNLFKAGADLLPKDSNNLLSPSSPGYINALPVFILFQYEPVSAHENLLKALTSTYCANIGHLAAFHPEAVDLVMKLDFRFWNKLATCFRST